MNGSALTDALRLCCFWAGIGLWKNFDEFQSCRNVILAQDGFIEACRDEAFRPNGEDAGMQCSGGRSNYRGEYRVEFVFRDDEFTRITPVAFDQLFSLSDLLLANRSRLVMKYR